MKAVQAVAVSAGDEQAVEEPGPIVAPVEIEVLRELLGLLVEDVQRAVHVGDEQPRGAAGFLADRIHPGEQHLVVSFSDRLPGDGQRRIVLNLERQGLLRLCGGGKTHQRENQGNPHVSPLGGMENGYFTRLSPRHTTLCVL